MTNLRVNPLEATIADLEDNNDTIELIYNLCPNHQRSYNHRYDSGVYDMEVRQVMGTHGNNIVETSQMSMKQGL